jgi:hypothetical protein
MYIAYKTDTTDHFVMALIWINFALVSSIERSVIING